MFDSVTASHRTTFQSFGARRHSSRIPAVGALIQDDLQTLPASALMADALYLMCLTDVRCIAVMEKGRLIGVLMARDLLQLQSVQFACRRSAIEAGTPSLAKTLSLASLVKKVPVVSRDMPATTAAKVMLAHDQDVLGVTDEAGELVGFVTQRDFVVAYAG